MLRQLAARGSSRSALLVLAGRGTASGRVALRPAGPAAASATAAARAALSTTSTTGTAGTGTPGTGTNMPVWPPPRSQLAKMYEDQEDEFNSSDPEMRAAAALRREQQLEEERMAGADFHDDHHYVPSGGAGGNASLSPHHEGYDEAMAGRRLRQRQRMDAFKRGGDATSRSHAATDVLAREQEEGLHLDGAQVSEEPLRQAAPRDLKSFEDGDDDDHDGGSGGHGRKAGGGGSGNAPTGGSGGSSGSGSGSGSGAPGWSWAQPPQAHGADARPGGRRFAGVSIPVRARTLLSEEEVVGALEALGGQEVQVVDVRGKGNLDAQAMVFASGRSGAHLRRMADTLVLALKQRGIEEREAPGVTGAEGYDCDDWMIVDGGNLIVHLMEPRQRKALALEAHWGQADFQGLNLPPTTSDAAWEAAHDRALEEAPHAADDDQYDPLRDDHRARERAFRRLVQGGGSGKGADRVRVRRAGRRVG